MGENDARKRARSEDTSRTTVFDDLWVRARAAAQSSARLGNRSLVLVAVSRNLRSSRLVVWCAWCGAFSDGRGHWAHLPDVQLKPNEMTASICPSCTSEALAWASFEN